MCLDLSRPTNRPTEREGGGGGREREGGRQGARERGGMERETERKRDGGGREGERFVTSLFILHTSSDVSTVKVCSVLLYQDSVQSRQRAVCASCTGTPDVSHESFCGLSGLVKQ